MTLTSDVGHLTEVYEKQLKQHKITKYESIIAIGLFGEKKVRSTHTKTAQYYENDTKNKTLPFVQYPTKFVMFQERKLILYSAIELRSVGYNTKSNNDDEVNMRYDIRIIWA